MSDEEVKDRLYKLEHELVYLKFIKPVNYENAGLIKSILEKMQPLYKQLGGIYISKLNLNYFGDAEN